MFYFLFNSFVHNFDTVTNAQLVAIIAPCFFGALRCVNLSTPPHSSRRCRELIVTFQRNNAMAAVVKPVIASAQAAPAIAPAPVAPNKIVSGMDKGTIAALPVSADKPTMVAFSLADPAHDPAVKKPPLSPKQRMEKHCTEMTRARATRLVFAFVFSASGLILMASSLQRIASQESRCADLLGEDIWSRASPRVYFENGFFSATGCGFQHITDLDLSGLKLTEVNPNLALLSALASIDASSNKLTQIPSAFTQLPSLKAFDVSNNAIADIPMQIFVTLKGVQSTSFSGNPVGETIDWSNSDLRVLPSALSRLSELKRLILRNTKLERYFGSTLR